MGEPFSDIAALQSPVMVVAPQRYFTAPYFLKRKKNYKNLDALIQLNASNPSAPRVTERGGKDHGKENTLII
ncbi:hypothetical protein J6590_080996 [Homalodisca vitripennis]|nr:hypothetical protein J6590_080996 [Homalodisca vitripennis]